MTRRAPRLRICALVALATSASPVGARAALPGHEAALQSTSPPERRWIDFAGLAWRGTVGWTFHVGPRDLRVDHLGLYDAGANGLAESHQVGLWQTNGTLIASVTVRAGSAATLVDGYRYESITPVTLTANTNYRLGAFYSVQSGDSMLFNSTQVYSPFVSFVRSQQTTLSPGVTFGFPNIDATLPEGIFGPNLLFESSADLSLTVTTTAAEARAGEDVRFTLSVANAGPNSSGRVRVASTLPRGTTFDSASAPAGWTLTTPAIGATGEVAATIDVLPTGSSDLLLALHVDPAIAARALVLTATASAGTDDPNTANDVATLSLPVFVEPPDAGVHPDAEPIDLGFEPDAAEPIDAGFEPDAAEPDAAEPDAAEPIDAGLVPDAALADLGVAPDAEPQPDARVELDAAPVDAGPSSGVAEDGCSCAATRTRGDARTPAAITSALLVALVAARRRSRTFVTPRG